MSIFKLFTEFPLMPRCGLTPFSKIFHFTIDAATYDSIVTLELKCSILMINDFRLSIKALSCVESGFKFVNSHYLFPFCFVCALSISYFFLFVNRHIIQILSDCLVCFDSLAGFLPPCYLLVFV